MTSLLLKGGTVYDSSQGIKAQKLDIAVRNAKIAELAANIDPKDFDEIIDVTNKIVAPGLIDLHCHVFHGFNSSGVHPDVVGVGSGVTTVVDGGSAGHSNFGGFPTYIIPNSKTRVLCMIHISSTGLSVMPELTSIENIDVEQTARVVRENFPLTRGIKIRAIGPTTETLGVEIVKLAKQAAIDSKTRLMVHIGELYHQGKTLTQELLPLLTRGDILTHTFTPNPGKIIDAQGKVLSEVFEAQKKGVTLDTAFGRYNFSFDIAKMALDQGLIPNTISTDMTILGRQNSAHSMTEMLTRFVALGFSLEDVIKMTTENSAIALDMLDSIGTLRIGNEADISVLSVVKGDWNVSDVKGNILTTSKAIIPYITIKTGDVITPDFGPHPWGFLPNRNIK
ncbi:MAG: dihydroorotase [Chloroflexi bacterium]|jgi:dihydroorotase|nr:MAG: dihydroorotase [Chloroflexota bacterium]